MAEGEGAGEAVGQGFQKQLGPLKVWQWGVLVVGSIVAIVIVRKYMGGGSGGSGDAGTQAAYLPLPGANQTDASTNAIAALEQQLQDQGKKLQDSIAATAAGEQSDVQALSQSQLAGNQALQSAFTQTANNLEAEIAALQASGASQAQLSAVQTELEQTVANLNKIGVFGASGMTITNPLTGQVTVRG